jgi:hypothetical protein
MAPSTMSTVTSAAPATSLEIPAHLRENFEKAEARLRKAYGESPPVHDLMRLWLACASSWDIERQFEEGVLEIKGSTLRRTDEGDYDEQALNL